MKNKDLLEELEQYKKMLAVAEARANRAEEALQESRQSFAHAENIATIGHWSLDLKTGQVSWSSGHYRIFGYQEGLRQDFYQMFRERVHPDDIEIIHNQIKIAIGKNQPYSIDYRIVLPDDTIRYIHEETDRPALNIYGRPVKLFGIIKDITRYRQAEEALHLSEVKYRNIVETANEGICIIDEKSQISFANEKILTMTGYTQAEALGQDVYQFVCPDYRDIMKKNLRTRQSSLTEQIDYKLKRKDGTAMWVIASSSPIYSGDGKFMGILAMLNDITDRKQADEQLKASLKEKEALLKEIHHRVKNNLQIISSLLNLQSSVISDEKYKELLMDSQNRIKSMALLHELLYKSKDLSSINMSEYIPSLIRYISRSYQRYSGHATLHTDVENISIDIEKAINVGIIVTEIVSNSIKYAFPGDRTGEIRIALHRQGPDIVMAITDNGIGLPEGMDLQNTPTLGLQLVDILTQQLGGTLEIGRRDPTSFTISFKESVKPN